MATAFEAIQTVTVGTGGQAAMEFTSIPATFTDLFILQSGRSSTGSPDQDIQFNSNASNYSAVYMFNVGGSLTGGSTSSIPLVGLPKSTYTSNTFGSTSIYIPSYRGSGYKSVSAESVAPNNSTSDYFVWLCGGVWSDTAAITSIKLRASSPALYTEHSTATLYGIKKS